MEMFGIFERENILNGLQGMSLRLFRKSLGWSAEETSELLAKGGSEMKTNKQTQPITHINHCKFVSWKEDSTAMI